MNSISPINFNDSSLLETDTNDTLSRVIFEKVLFYVDEKSIQSTVLVNRIWKTVSINTKLEQSAKLKAFVKWLINNLQNASSINQFKELFNSIKNVKYLNLIEFKEKILTLLRSLELSELGRLRKLFQNETKPYCLENIFLLAQLYIIIDQANLVEDQDKRDELFQEISKEFVRTSEFDRALEIINFIFRDFRKYLALKAIPKHFIKNSQPDKAIEIINTISYPYYKQRALIDLYQKRGNFDKALEIVNTFSDCWERAYALEKLCRKLARNGNLDRAFEISDTISCHPYHKDDVLAILCPELAKNGNINKAIEIINSFCSNRLKWDVLKTISKDLAKHGYCYFDKAFEIANAFSDTCQKEMVFEHVCQEMIENGDVDKALEIASAISEPYRKTRVLEEIFRKLAEDGEMDKALEILSSFPYDLEKEDALRFISKDLIKYDDSYFEKAFKIAEAISNPYYKERAIKALSEDS